MRGSPRDHGGRRLPAWGGSPSSRRWTRRGEGRPNVRTFWSCGPGRKEVDWRDGRDRWWPDDGRTQSTEHTPESFDAEQPLYIIYTSGTTGKPKGILHTTGGYLTQVSYTH